MLLFGLSDDLGGLANDPGPDHFLGVLVRLPFEEGHGLLYEQACGIERLDPQGAGQRVPPVTTHVEQGHPSFEFEWWEHSNRPVQVAGTSSRDSSPGRQQWQTLAKDTPDILISIESVPANPSQIVEESLDVTEL